MIKLQTWVGWRKQKVRIFTQTIHMPFGSSPLFEYKSGSLSLRHLGEDFKIYSPSNFDIFGYFLGKYPLKYPSLIVITGTSDMLHV